MGLFAEQSGRSPSPELLVRRQQTGLACAFRCAGRGCLHGSRRHTSYDVRPVLTSGAAPVVLISFSRRILEFWNPLSKINYNGQTLPEEISTELVRRVCENTV